MPELSDALPSCDRVRVYFETYRGKTAFHPRYTKLSGDSVEVDTLVGNNGDGLIRLGAEKLLEELSIKSAPSAEAADLIVLDGNGGMLDTYRTIPLILSKYALHYKNTPLVMLPATFAVAPGRINTLIGERGSPMTLFCRERKSYDSLRNDKSIPEWCDIQIDHDMAFFLKRTHLVTDLLSYAPEHVLFVERLDAEHVQRNFTPHWSLSIRRGIAKRVPASVKPYVYPTIARFLGRRRSSFREKCEKLLRENQPEAMKYPIISCDISLPNVSSFDDFCVTIAKSAVVFTTRLHVGILAIMLGRPTYLFEGPYHKIRGIYEHSLAGVDGVTLVSGSRV